MKNRYLDTMEKIKAPNSLKDRVLNTAYMSQAQTSDNARQRQRHRAVFRTAVCAACTFALLLSGSLFLYKPGAGSKSSVEGTESAVPHAYHFGLVAYAANNSKTISPVDNRIAFAIKDSGGGTVNGKGDYTGCLFRITGDGIKTVSASIDRGGLYRYTKLTNLTKDEISAIYASEANGTLQADCQFASSGDEKTWCSEQMKALGSSFSENWTADSSYGFWVPPASVQNDPKMDLQQAAHKEIDTFNGATLTITATFNDGSEQTQTLHLKTGKLKVVFSEDHTQTLLPELASGDDPYNYGVYAELDK